MLKYVSLFMLDKNCQILIITSFILQGDFFPEPLGHLFPEIDLLRLLGLVHKHFYSYLR
jgi:hypothetical protein